MRTTLDQVASSQIPSRPASRYHGSKFNLSKWIISHFPDYPRPDCYAEPYGGGGSTLLQLPCRYYLEVYNDLDGDVVNYFRVLRETPDELIRQIELTPYARSEWALSLQETTDPLERARRFYVRSYMNIAGPTAGWRSGWRRQKVVTRQNGKKRMTPAPISFMNTHHLYTIANRLRGVQIENDTAFEVIKRYDSAATLFYIDPPYPAGTRGRWKKTAYRFEMTDADHCELAGLLHSIKGQAVVSGYRCDLYDELYTGWQRFDKKARVNGPGQAVESIWLSPRASTNRLTLFSSRRKQRAKLLRGRCLANSN